jgi:hypothetical protein
MSPIVLNREDPPPSQGIASDLVWSVYVIPHEDDVIMHWRATCDTFDEAIELADSYRKRYYVSIDSHSRDSVAQ